MSKLQPVTIVDKNGRTTTVHRRDAKKSSTGTGLPAPKIGPQNGTQGTPLEPITPATKNQTRKLIQEFESGEEYWPMDYNLITTKMSKKDHTLIKRLLDDPAVNNIAVLSCVQFGVSDETITKEEVTNALLILERMSTAGDGSLIEHSGPYSFYHAVLGADQVGTRPYLDNVQPITTQEELESKSAFVTFVMLADENHQNDDSILRRGMKQFNFKYKREYYVLNNKHLRDLIMERPDKQHEITDYVRARGMHKVNKKPVDTLRAYLDEPQTKSAVSSGWL